MNITLGLNGNYNYGNLSSSGNISYGIPERKLRANGKIRSRLFGSLNTDYSDSELHLYSKPSFLTKCISKLGYWGNIGLGLLGGLSCYMSVPADDPYRTIGAIGAGLAVGLLSFFASRPAYKIKL